MLNGPLTKGIIMFALPLMASGVLQQSFNAVDIAVVGRYCSSEALAAVGSNGPIISILVNLFLGVSVGANVVIANYIGRRNESGIRRSIATAASLAVISGVILALVSQVLVGPILVWMGAPREVMDLAGEYLRIYFMGMPFMMAYNFGSAILRSMGDTRSPFYALCAGTVVNVALDFLFVGAMGMGVAGVAIGTVVANGVNAAIIIWVLVKQPLPYTLSVGRLTASWSDLKKMLVIGVPAGLQGMVFSSANLCIQAAVNSYGAAVIAGSAAALTYESYGYFIIVSFAQATVAFMSQNYGAQQYARCRQVVWRCMILSVISSIVVTEIIGLFSADCISVFSTDPDVIHWGEVRIRVALLPQFLACSYEIAGSAMRGLGNSLTPMLLTVIGTCALRLVWVYTVNAHYHDFEVLVDVYPISWVVTGTMVVWAYLRMARRCLR